MHVIGIMFLRNGVRFSLLRRTSLVSSTVQQVSSRFSTVQVPVEPNGMRREYL